jgi:hypothetical protein
LAEVERVFLTRTQQSSLLLRFLDRWIVLHKDTRRQTGFGVRMLGQRAMAEM